MKSNRIVDDLERDYYQMSLFEDFDISYDQNVSNSVITMRMVENPIIRAILQLAIKNNQKTETGSISVIKANEYIELLGRTNARRDFNEFIDNANEIYALVKDEEKDIYGKIIPISNAFRIGTDLCIEFQKQAEKFFGQEETTLVNLKIQLGLIEDKWSHTDCLYNYLMFNKREENIIRSEKNMKIYKVYIYEKYIKILLQVIGCDTIKDVDLKRETVKKVNEILCKEEIDYEELEKVMKNAGILREKKRYAKMLVNDIEQINEKTDMYIQYEVIKNGRWIVGYNLYYFEKKKKKPETMTAYQREQHEKLKEAIKECTENQLAKLLDIADYNAEMIIEKYNGIKAYYEMREEKIQHPYNMLLKAIIKNWEYDNPIPAKKKTKNAFNNFPQREYDFKKLEEELLSN